jgi:hypothetical protein
MRDNRTPPANQPGSDEPGGYWALAVVLGMSAALCAALWYSAPLNPQPAPVPVVAPAAPQPVAGGEPARHFGYAPNAEATAAYVATLEAPTIREASPEMFTAAPPTTEVFLFRALNAAHIDRFGVPWKSEAQGIGDCVSWGGAHAVDIVSAVNYQEGETAEWWPAATESLYGGSRVEAGNDGRPAGYSDGSWGSACAEWITKWGVIHRKKYDIHDLTRYSSSRAKDWGNWGNGGRGDDGKFDAIAKEFPVGAATLVTTFDEAVAAIRSGYAISVCSGQGFSSTRDSDGFARASGSWAHCMCFTSFRLGARPGLLCQNSWGTTWISGPKYPEDQPEGSFWVEKDVVNRMLSGRDSFAYSKIKGFPFRPLDHAAWATTPAKPKRRAPYDVVDPMFAISL